MRRGYATALLVVASLLCVPAAARAQVRGVVTDSAGRPLPGVLVELWDAQRRLAGDGTDASGRFRLAAAGTGPRALLARRVGFEPLRRVLPQGDSEFQLVMQPLAVEIAAVTVETEPVLCPERDDPRARALWEHAASRYDVAISAYGVGADAMLFSALLPVESLGVTDTMRLEGWYVQGSYSALAFETRFATQANFYAVPTSRRSVRRYDRWIYQPLESSRAWHFGDSLFSRMNRLAFTRTTLGDTVIAFCSSLGTRPYIRGTLRIAPDTTFAAADWEFVTTSRREEAGGHVLFAPADARASGQSLLPAAGLFWRRLLRLVYQEWMEYRQWYRCERPGSCRAPVPVR